MGKDGAAGRWPPILFLGKAPLGGRRSGKGSACGKQFEHVDQMLVFGVLHGNDVLTRPVKETLAGFYAELSGGDAVREQRQRLLRVFQKGVEVFGDGEMGIQPVESRVAQSGR